MKKLKMILLFLCLSFLLSGCHIGWAKNGPYHHPVTLQTPSQIVMLDNNVYCLFSSKLYQLKDGAFSKITLEIPDISSEYKSIFIRQIAANSNFLFALTDQKGVPYVYIFDKTLKCVDSIKVFATSILANDNALFYLNGDSKLMRLDLSTKETIEQKIDSVNDCYSFGEEIIYINTAEYLYFVDNSEANTYFSFKNTYYYDEAYLPHIYTASFLASNVTGTIKFENNNLYLNYGSSHLQMNMMGNWSVYDNIRVNADKVYIAMHEYLTSSECLEDWGDCFCHFGKTKLFVYDTKNNTLSQSKELESGSFLINFDEDGYLYYQNGIIYYNSLEIKDIEAVSLNTSFYQYGEASFLKSTEKENYLFCCFNGRIFFSKLSYEIKNVY